MLRALAAVRTILVQIVFDADQFMAAALQIVLP
jgi:hypothetical protein